MAEIRPFVLIQDWMFDLGSHALVMFFLLSFLIGIGGVGERGVILTPLCAILTLVSF